MPGQFSENKYQPEEEGDFFRCLCLFFCISSLVLLGQRPLSGNSEPGVLLRHSQQDVSVLH